MRTLLRLAGEYSLCGVLASLLLVWLYDLPHRDLRIPLDQGGDALDCLMYSKTIVDHRWVLNNPDLGAPHGATFHDYQRSATLQFLYLKLLGWAIDDPLLLTNVYFLLTFPVTAMLALAVFRHFQLPYGPALTASLLYAFLPYHSLRNLSHLYLAGYFVLPLAIAVVLWVFLEEPLFFWPGRDRPGGRTGCTRKGWASLLIAAATASTDIYYGYFTCFFLLTAGLAASWRNGRRWPCAPALLLIGVSTAATLVNFIPQGLYNREHGPNAEAGRRATSDAEHFALRISQMVTPTSGHRLPLLNHAKQRFNAKLYAVTESDMASLGVLGSIGLLYLLGLLLLPGGADDRRGQTLHALAVLNISAVLVGSIGGFSLLIASAFPYIRCYNRLSVYIAFFALFALAHLLQRGLARLPERSGSRALGTGFCLFLVVLGAWDQTPASTAEQPPAVRRAFASDRDFVAQLEARLPEGGMVFQLPYFPYPEGGSYDPLRLYLHSHSLKWSFAAMRGRYADLWQRRAAEQSPEEAASILAWSGFAGVCWDCRSDAAAEARWQALLGAPTLVSEDGRVAFYSLAGCAARLRAGCGEEQWEQRREEALHPVLVCWGRGFQQIEDPRRNGGRWANHQSDLLLFNPGSVSRRVQLGFQMRTFQPGATPLRMQGPNGQQEATIDGKVRPVRTEMVVPPGRSCLRFRCDGAMDPDHDRRVFQVIDYTVRVVPPVGEPRPGMARLR